MVIACVRLDALLAVNAIEAGTLRLERAPLDLRDVVTRALGVVQPLLRERGQTLEIDLPDPLSLRGGRVAAGAGCDQSVVQCAQTHAVRNARRGVGAGETGRDRPGRA